MMSTGRFRIVVSAGVAILAVVLVGAVAIRVSSPPLQDDRSATAGASASSSALAAASPAPAVAASTPGSEGAVLVGAGDIARCDLGDDSATAALIAAIPGTVFVAGDVAYQRGTAEEFRDCYGPTWGAFQDRTLPAPGNHEYKTPGAAGYYGQFGAAAGTPGEGWYATDVGTWRVIVLNAECADVGGCGEGSPELAWLRSELAAHPARCTVAIWHEPRWSSGAHGDDAAVGPFWTALYLAGAELVLNGHDHDYERFAPQDPSGRRDLTQGIREFVVGTGGAQLRPLRERRPNQQAADAQTHGVLKLTLRPDGYDWVFLPVAGETFTDSGSGACHGALPVLPAPSAESPAPSAASPAASAASPAPSVSRSPSSPPGASVSPGPPD